MARQPLGPRRKSTRKTWAITSSGRRSRSGGERLLEPLEARLLLSGSVLYRVNAGGSLLAGDPAWQADTLSSPSPYVNAPANNSNVYSVSRTIDLTDPSVPAGTPMALFQRERWDAASGEEMRWSFPVAGGQPYEVRLYFAEIYWSEAGKRVFDVSIEGTQVLNDFDIYAEVGKDKGLVKTFTVTSDATLEVDFVHGLDSPAIKGIEILDAAPSPNVLGAVPEALDLGTVSIGGSVSASVTLRNLGAAGDPDIVVDATTITGAQAGMFSDDFNDAGSVTLAPGASTTVTVTFDPTATGTAGASLDVTHSGAGGLLSVPLTGIAAPAGAGEALVVINPGGTILTSSTYTTGSFRVYNQSPAGVNIQAITFDMRGALLPDIVFDPFGDGGDPVSKGFTADTGAAAVGLVGHEYLWPHEGGGNDGLRVTFSDFQPGEEFRFSIDADPTSIKGAPAPGPNDSGSISGLEMTATTITVEFSNGTQLTMNPFRQGSSLIVSDALVRTVLPAAPTIQVLGVAAPATVSAASQTVRVTGPVGAAVTLLRAEGGLYLDGVPGGGYDIDPYEANNIIAMEEYAATIGAGGYVDIAVTLTKADANAGVNHFVAVLRDTSGVAGPTSNVLVVEYEPAAGNQAPVLAPIGPKSVQAGQTLNVQVSATDPDGHAITLSVAGLPAFGTFVDHGNGTGTLSFTPGAGDVASYPVTVTATDTGSPALSDAETFTLSVLAEQTGGVLYRVNAGGPQLTADPVWTADSSASPSPYGNAGAAGSSIYTTSAAIDMTHASIPAGTPMAVFQSERWDAATGAEMQWNFPVTAGRYEVRLYFAEVFHNAIGLRVFDVTLEGQLVLDDYDVYAEAGYRKGVVETFVLNNLDGNIDIDFLHAVDNPAIKGIEILALPSGPNTLSASSSNVAFGSVLINASAQRTLTLYNLGGTGDPDIIVDATTITGAGAGVFSDNFNDAGSVAIPPGGSADIVVAFSPTSQASYTATLEITHSGNGGVLSVPMTGNGVTSLPVGFGKSVLAGASPENPTSIQFGPDGRLYVSEQNGLIRVYTVQRNAANNYAAVLAETVTQIQAIPNHNDNGALNPSVTERLVTGILVVGTAANPVIYAVSTDPRIGAGPSGTDLNLDTNSGVLSRLTWTGSAWQRLDLVRGLPRSEENHHANGLALDPATNTLYIAQGGNTNMGAPSNNFALLPEFALSAAILSVDLDAIGETTYDLPTLDDEDRSGVNDLNDPFGGNDGKNQAKLVPGGPVQVYAPGFRNPYDIVITQAGRMYTVDNGSNGGWGDVPINEGPGGNATNDPNEPGVSYGDTLHYVTGPGYYGGHPNPTRSNPNNTFNASNPQSPVTVGNPIESDFQGPSENGSLALFPTSTNGLVEYTASNFGGAMQGDLLTASFTNKVYRIEFDATGTVATSSAAIFSNVGSVPLDITALGDDGAFPGTVWVTDWQTNKIYVFEPIDYNGSGQPGTGEYDPTLDDDGDGYNNADEIDNGTNPLSAGDVPTDWDQDFLSDLNDPDDDNDDLLDTEDPFAIDPQNGRGTAIPVSYTWENDAPSPGGLLNLGFTGLMTNGITNYADLFDPAQMTAGGAAGVMTVDLASEGDAFGANNDQEYAFQFGVDVDAASGPFTAHTAILGPFSGLTPANYQSMGLFVGTGNQDNYVKIVASANGGAGGIEFATEIGGVYVTQAVVPLALPGPSTLDLYLSIDPSTGLVEAGYAVNGGTIVAVGVSAVVPLSWFTQATAPAVGVISTSRGPAAPFPVTWDFIEVMPNVPGTLQAVPANVSFGSLDVHQHTTRTITLTNLGGFGNPDILVDATMIAGTGAAAFSDDFNDAGGITLTPGTSTEIVVTFAPAVGGAFAATLEVSHSGQGGTLSIPLLGTGTVPSQGALYRINAGGPSQAGGWLADTKSSPSPYANTSAAGNSVYSTGATIDMSHASIPAGTPMAVFQTERWDPSSGAEMQWDLPATAGQYEVRLYFAEIYHTAAGKRVFDVSIEGQQVLNDYDVYADVGYRTGVVKSFLVTVTDGNLDIDFLRAIDAPAIKGIEVLSHASLPNVLNATPEQVAAGTIAVNQVVTRTITLTNLGTAGDPDIVIDATTITGAGAAAFSDDFNDAGSVTLAPGASTEIVVTFAPTGIGSYGATLEIAHTGQGGTLSIPLSGSAASMPLYRINAGGPSQAGGWLADTKSSPSPYANTSAAGNSVYSTGATIDMSHASIPAGTPEAIFRSERWDPSSGAEMQWDLPVTTGQYEVRLYFAEIYYQAAGVRVFDVSIEGQQVLNDYDVYADVGYRAGVVKSFLVSVTDGNLDIDFLRVIENPAIKGIEVLAV